MVRLALLLCPVSLLDAPDATKWGITVGLVKREKKLDQQMGIARGERVSRLHGGFECEKDGLIQGHDRGNGIDHSDCTHE